jgi:sigma-B regulation protein RsbU (phosphoserine phosphatase)
MRYRRDGRIVFAGAHEEIIVCRASTGKCEFVQTVGPWVGAMPDVGSVTVDAELKLEDGDLMVLYTDGLTEAMDDKGEQFGMERLTAALEARQGEPVERIRDEILDSVARWAPKQEDDITLLIMRYHAPKERLA